MKQHAVGIDIGGTSTRVALISEDLKVIDRTQFFTDKKDPKKTVCDIVETIRAIGIDTVGCIGLSCPGPLDTIGGKIIKTPNLKAEWHGYPIVRELQERTSLPVCLENDANLACLAEAVVGEGKDYSHVQFLTVSTGLGCALAVDQKIFRGAHGLANEAANVIFWQNGPAQGSILPGGIEAICSGAGISSRAEKAGLPTTHPGEIYNLALTGNEVALRIYADAENYLATFIAALIQLNDPDIVILGGSVALKTSGLIDRVRNLTMEKLPETFKPFVKIRKTTLKEDSGLLGAAILAFQNADCAKTNILL